MWVLNEENKTPLYAQLYRQIKADILSGKLKPGTKLKSSRAVSAEFRISRNTVELAYNQLFAEGFIISQPRKGYYVDAQNIHPFLQCEAVSPQQELKVSEPEILYDFQRGRLLLSDLPCSRWQRLLNRCFQDNKEALALKKSVFGELGLRTEIQKQLHNYRNVTCKVEQIVVTTGTQFCLDLICRLLHSIHTGAEIAMEEPGDDQSRITLQNHGFFPYPMGVDSQGAMAKSLTGTNVTAAYVTPSHQFPTGTVMSLSRRNEFAQWAVRKNTFLIEDDHNCHFQHGHKPLPSIQSLCPDRVFYIGGFSDILFPCVNVSYLVVPEPLLDTLHQWIDHHAPFVPFLTQKPLELFLKEGYWESHLRKMRKIQTAKCESLLSALKNKFGDSISISGFQSGLHLLIQARWPASEEELIHQARLAGVGVYPTSQYWFYPVKYEYGTVLLNYGGIPLEEISVAVDLLYQAWRGDKSR
ncbi:MocR-like pyridoxine biosynthesis transcription factor PdxR [Clostridium minihomine]|uniref:MocR-like pyridoxine biosynthesis transcription factor PdxR n=1 Tax=Clostridium minihomine TaxID=2045012 RepID=UPI000C75A40E|nr:PLP-dependent aminotransferase family protein [Clostridium minihomine]